MDRIYLHCIVAHHIALYQYLWLFQFPRNGRWDGWEDAPGQGLGPGPLHIDYILPNDISNKQPGNKVRGVLEGLKVAIDWYYSLQSEVKTTD